MLYSMNKASHENRWGKWAELMSLPPTAYCPWDYVRGYSSEVLPPEKRHCFEASVLDLASTSTIYTKSTLTTLPIPWYLTFIISLDCYCNSKPFGSADSAGLAQDDCRPILASPSVRAT
jgi:hypothetical protein